MALQISGCGIADAVSEIAKIFSSYFGYEKEETSRQSEKKVIKDSRQLEKAVGYAEELIFLIDDTMKDKMDRKIQRRYERLRKSFFKCN